MGDDLIRVCVCMHSLALVCVGGRGRGGGGGGARNIAHVPGWIGGMVVQVHARSFALPSASSRRCCWPSSPRWQEAPVDCVIGWMDGWMDEEAHALKKKPEPPGSHASFTYRNTYVKNRPEDRILAQRRRVGVVRLRVDVDIQQVAPCCFGPSSSASRSSPAVLLHDSRSSRSKFQSKRVYLQSQLAPTRLLLPPLLAPPAAPPATRPPPLAARQTSAGTPCAYIEVGTYMNKASKIHPSVHTYRHTHQKAGLRPSRSA